MDAPRAGHAKLTVTLRTEAIRKSTVKMLTMSVTIFDDSFDTLRMLSSFQKLDGHDVAMVVSEIIGKVGGQFGKGSIRSAA